MPSKEDEATSTLNAVNLIGCPAQLYEFHEAAEETKRFGLAQWLRPIPPRTILIAAPDMRAAMAYLAAHMPDFQVQTVTPRGSVFMVCRQM